MGNRTRSIMRSEGICLIALFFLPVSAALCAEEKKTDGSVLGSSIYSFPLSYRREPVGFRKELPGYRPEPIGFRKEPPGYRGKPMGFREKSPNALDEPRGFSPNPPNFIEKDKHPAADKDPGKRIEIKTHPNTDNRKQLRLTAIAGTKNEAPKPDEAIPDEALPDEALPDETTPETA